MGEELRIVANLLHLLGYASRVPREGIFSEELLHFVGFGFAAERTTAERNACVHEIRICSCHHARDPTEFLLEEGPRKIQTLTGGI